MTYLSHITHEQLLAALSELEKFPGSSDTLNYGLVYNGRSFPPKLLLLKVYEMTGIDAIPIQSVEIDALLKELAEQGFEVYPKQDGLAEMLNESVAEKDANRFLKQQQKKTKRKKVAANLDTSSPPYTVADEPEITYTMEEKTASIFMSEASWQGLKTQLLRKKNLILQGAAGTGKSFLAKRLALELCQYKTENTELIQFHQSYSYEDFVMGIRPKEGIFAMQKGIFYRFCERAIAKPQQPFVMVIEEINRGNVSKIFGELLFLLDADKRGKQHALILTYSENETFYLPENLYLIATMNTADRSLTLMDFALRRRFAFAEVKPCFDANFQQFVCQKTKYSQEKVTQMCHKIQVINEMIETDNELGEAFLIGHGYFLSFDNQPFEHWYKAVIEYEVLPLLQTYWFDRKDKYQKAKNLLSDSH